MVELEDTFVSVRNFSRKFNFTIIYDLLMEKKRTTVIFRLVINAKL